MTASSCKLAALLIIPALLLFSVIHGLPPGRAGGGVIPGGRSLLPSSTTLYAYLKDDFDRADKPLQSANWVTATGLPEYGGSLVISSNQGAGDMDVPTDVLLWTESSSTTVTPVGARMDVSAIANTNGDSFYAAIILGAGSSVVAGKNAFVKVQQDETYVSSSSNNIVVEFTNIVDAGGSAAAAADQTYSCGSPAAIGFGTGIGIAAYTGKSIPIMDNFYLISDSTPMPTATPTAMPTAEAPTPAPTKRPTRVPTLKPTQTPTGTPTQRPTMVPTAKPTTVPTPSPTKTPTSKPTQTPTRAPTKSPTRTRTPTTAPTKNPTARTNTPTAKPTRRPTKTPAAQ